MREKGIGNLYAGRKGGNYGGNVFDESHLSPTLNCMRGGNTQPMVVAMRGRPQGGGENRQQLETRNDGLTNTLTSVQKDNMLVEKEKRYRIRKLTPTECFRLMAVSDEDSQKMLSVNSKTQCYAQAGNSIVVTVLMGIFSQLGIEGVKRWNDLTDDEIYELIDSKTK